MNRRILITGCRGMLGAQLAETLVGAGQVVGVDIDQGDLSDMDVCRRIVKEASPDVVVNAAAFTRVDDCEMPEILPKAMAANARIPKNLARLCKESGALLVHISTDYVYDGKKDDPYVEDDEPAPLSAYGRSKLAGDEAVIASGCKYLILRTAWLFGRHGHNFIEAILRQADEKDRLRVVNDQRGAPTSTIDLAEGIKIALDHSLAGLFHFACRGSTTWLDYAKKICEFAGIDVPVDPITTEQLGLPAPRPANSLLDCTRFIQATGFEPRTWQRALADYVEKRRTAG